MAASNAAPDRPRIVGGRIGDPTRDVVGQPVPVVLPDPATLFERRAERLDTLAAGHPMADWLRFMARLARGQQGALKAMPAAEPVEVVEGEPPLDHPAEPAWQTALAAVLSAMDDATLPDQTRATVRRLLATDAASLEALADAFRDGAVRQEDTGATVFVVAALSVDLVRRAAALPLPDLHLLPQRGRCPACGFTPVAGVITGAGRLPGTGYLHCGLCATAWNHTRAVCIACGGSRGLALLGIEGNDGAVQAETCDECHSYAKMLYQAKDMAVEAMADDLASLGLDMLVSEAGYQRHASNPLVIGAG